jgi:hypothetical protein
LPNYVLPMYPPLALLMGHFLDRWRRGAVTPPAWVMRASLASLLLVGILTTLGLLLASGAFGTGLVRDRHLPALRSWAVIGLVPLAGGLAGWRCLRRQQPAGVVIAVTLTAIVTIGALAGWGTDAVDRYKAPRALTRILQAHQAQQPEEEVFIGTFEYFQPSLVFYCRRQVIQWQVDWQVMHFLSSPIPAYLFLSDRAWECLRPRLLSPFRVLGRHRDLYRGCEVVLVTNR